MISYKTVITLTLIILGIKHVASTSSATTLKKKTEKADSLRDMNNRVTDVPVTGGTLVQVDQIEEQPVPVINDHFKRLIEQENYVELEGRIKTMDKGEFIAQICPIVKTHEQYKNLENCFKQHGMVEHFYVYGDMTVVKDVIGDGPFQVSFQPRELQKAIELALEKDKHERVCELLKARQDGTTERDRNRIKEFLTSFEYFMFALFSVLALWKNTKPLARFITFYGKEFNDKYPDIHAIFYERLVEVTHDKCLFGEPDEKEKAKKLLSDLVGQPSLLTPGTFSRGFLYNLNACYKIGFIEYGWKGAIEEGLNGKYRNGGELLWNVIRNKYPEQHFGNFPPSDETLIAVLKLFPTKQEREEAWIKAHAPILHEQLESLNLFPKVLRTLISQYALLWTDVC